jgi:hypothetical protein
VIFYTRISKPLGNAFLASAMEPNRLRVCIKGSNLRIGLHVGATPAISQIILELYGKAI